MADDVTGFSGAEVTATPAETAATSAFTNAPVSAGSGGYFDTMMDAKPGQMGEDLLVEPVNVADLGKGNEAEAKQAATVPAEDAKAAEPGEESTEAKAATEAAQDAPVDPLAGMSAEDIAEAVSLRSQAHQYAIDNGYKTVAEMQAGEMRKAEEAAVKAEENRVAALQQADDQKWHQMTSDALLEKWQAAVESGEVTVEQAQASLDMEFESLRRGRVIEQYEAEKAQATQRAQFQQHVTNVERDTAAAIKADPYLLVASEQATALIRNLAVAGGTGIADVATGVQIVQDLVKLVKEKAVAEYVAELASKQKNAAPTVKHTDSERISRERNDTPFNLKTMVGGWFDSYSQNPGAPQRNN